MNKKIDTTHIADLAQLCFAPEELKSLEKDMTEMLRLADKMQEFEIAEESVCSDKRKSVLRDDEPADSIPAAEMIGAAKTSRDGFITVPRVVEE